MNNNIQIGDFGEVVKWPCCGHRLGIRFVVSKVAPVNYTGIICSKCGAVPVGQGYLVWAPTVFVKKIDLPSEPEKAESTNEVNV